MSGPDSFLLGAALNRLGGGRRGGVLEQIALIYQATARGKVLATVERAKLPVPASGGSSTLGARRSLLLLGGGSHRVSSRAITFRISFSSSSTCSIKACSIPGMATIVIWTTGLVWEMATT